MSEATPNSGGKTDGTRGPGEAFFEVAQDKDGWHWCLWAGNGRPLARNAAPYIDQKQAVNAIRVLTATLPTAKLIVAAT